MHDLLRTILAYVLILGILVFIHELGHYLAARWRGVKVETFSIGFGPAIHRWHDRSGTEWRISAIPLGGFVKPHGFEGPEDATEEQKLAWIPGRTFHDKPVGSRALVIIMGPLFNFIFAILAFTVLFAVVGKPEIRGDITQVTAGSAADHAGLKSGDIITRIGNTPILGAEDVMATVAGLPGKQTTLGIHRGSETLTLPVTLGTLKQGGHEIGSLGIGFAVSPGKPVSLPAAFIMGLRETWDKSVMTLEGVWQIVSGQRSARELGGTIRIAQLSGQVASYGLASIISFMALLSINLGLINLFPIPVLDGGRLVFYVCEAIRGRPVSKKVQDVSMQAGMALIGALFLFSTVNDLTNVGLFHWLFHAVS
ncbi:RIP metalloprotease RseP [Gluconobacter kanchanaburiensis]|uniref:Zinc metalloprotease n=1 Tax=Gluconobacter kanchanaburiensis NBRC 103587 TaxID=1307948 RepID=A0A511B3M6_9PROT|nr:RIP metalloprotease RseP [Gluconobacter kanchanaburiensis]MBF0860799.1 RIP metalloprotease RseP [Gluconobacter kanchanaburiensis]GBR69819.1 zinc metallopeptidase [Gluconobacter kanchanaburiensis NBRC 103587]GEK95024.1 zinc metalloprotease [Gluconobacter kanchanaburiensis NBRC 103587]